MIREIVGGLIAFTAIATGVRVAIEVWFTEPESFRGSGLLVICVVLFLIVATLGTLIGSIVAGYT